jgi:hypothetical protein
MEKVWVALAATLALGACSCASLGYRPSVSIAPDRPAIARDLTVYQEKRAVILAPREPVNERGFGRYFGSLLFTELSQRAPFRQVDYRPEQIWFGLQSAPSDEYATAAAQANDLGFDLAIVVSIERFVYSRNAESLLELDLRLIDSLSGETVHAQRIVARGHVGSMPPFWDPSVNTPVERGDLVRAAASTLVRRMWVRWDEGETEAQFLERQRGDDEEEESEGGEGAVIGG